MWVVITLKDLAILQGWVWAVIYTNLQTWKVQKIQKSVMNISEISTVFPALGAPSPHSLSQNSACDLEEAAD